MPVKKARPRPKAKAVEKRTRPLVNTGRKQDRSTVITVGKQRAAPAAPAPAPVNPDALQPAKLLPGTEAIQYPSIVADPNNLLIASDGRPHPELKADSSLSPIVLNALTAMNAVRPSMMASDLATVGITAFVNVMGAKVKAVSQGDMSGIEATMTAQVVALDALFAQLVNKAQANIGGSYLEAGEAYMRLAFKAQAQCRATAETLGELKNPRPVFAKQVNMANGNQQINQSDGPQQVNNGPAAPEAARAGEKPLPANKLLEA
jgi:hypothetical protein